MNNSIQSQGHDPQQTDKSKNISDSWETCKEAAEKITQDTYRGWKEEIKGNFFLAGLFSILVTIFRVVTIRTAPSYSTDVFKFKLAIYPPQNVSDRPFPLTYWDWVQFILEPAIPTSHSDSASAELPNLLYSISLVLSLLVVLVGMFGLEWLSELFDRNTTGTTTDDHHDLQHHYLKHENLKAWGVFIILNTSPLLLALSLTLFFIGFIKDLWDSGAGIQAALPVYLLISLAILFAIGTSILKAFHLLWLANKDNINSSSTTLCPYRSPQASFILFTLSYFDPIWYLDPFSWISKYNWRKCDIWWDNKLKNTSCTTVFHGIFWITRSHKQSTKHKLAAYHSLHTTIHTFWKIWLNTPIYELDHKSTTSYLTRIEIPIILQNFETEFNISRSICDVARLSTFSEIYWATYVPAWEAGDKKPALFEPTLDTLTNILPATPWGRAFLFLPSNVHGCEAAASFLNAVTDMARQGIIVNNHILGIINGILHWARYNGEPRNSDDFASALQTLLQKLALFDSYDHEDESETSFYHRRYVQFTHSATILRPFLYNIPRRKGDGCGWDNFYFKMFLKIHNNMGSMYVHAIETQVPRSTLTYMDLFPCHYPLQISRATFIEYIDAIREQAQEETLPGGLEIFLKPFPDILKGISQDKIPFEQELFEALNMMLSDLLDTAANTRDDAMKTGIPEMIYQFGQELIDQQPLCNYEPRIQETIKKFQLDLECILTPDQLLQDVIYQSMYNPDGSDEHQDVEVHELDSSLHEYQVLGDGYSEQSTDDHWQSLSEPDPNVPGEEDVQENAHSKQATNSQETRESDSSAQKAREDQVPQIRRNVRNQFLKKLRLKKFPTCKTKIRAMRKKFGRYFDNLVSRGQNTQR